MPFNSIKKIIGFQGIDHWKGEQILSQQGAKLPCKLKCQYAETCGKRSIRENGHESCRRQNVQHQAAW